MNVQNTQPDTALVETPDRGGEIQVFTPKIKHNVDSSLESGMTAQNGVTEDTDVYMCDKDGDGWKTVQSKKRARISTDSTSTQPSPSPDLDKFGKMSVNDKLSALFTEVSGVNRKVDQFVVIHNKVNDLEVQVHEHSQRIEQLEYKSVDLEARSRRNNLIFGGISENLNENCTETIANFLRSELDIDHCPPMPRVHRLGRYKRNNIRPIIAYFLDYRDTDHILTKAKLLRGKSFSINRDYPREIANARKELWPQLKQLRSEYPKSNVTLAYPAKILKDGKVIADKFPRWNLLLHGNRISCDDTPSTGVRQSQHSRALYVSPPNTSEDNSPPRPLRNTASSQSKPAERPRRESRSPVKSGDRYVRGRAPSRESTSTSHQPHRSNTPGPNIRRPWSTPPQTHDTASAPQSLIDSF